MIIYINNNNKIVSYNNKEEVEVHYRG